MLTLISTGKCFPRLHAQQGNEFEPCCKHLWNFVCRNAFAISAATTRHRHMVSFVQRWRPKTVAAVINMKRRTMLLVLDVLHPRRYCPSLGSRRFTPYQFRFSVWTTIVWRVCTFFFCIFFLPRSFSGLLRDLQEIPALEESPTFIRTQLPSYLGDRAFHFPSKTVHRTWSESSFKRTKITESFQEAFLLGSFYQNLRNLQ